MHVSDPWGDLFRQIDQLLLFTPAVAALVPAQQRDWFLRTNKEPLHTQVYDLGWTTYLPVSRMTADDLVSCSD